jgi:hypothetical protein
MNNGQIVWRSEKRRISELRPAEYNPRELTEKQFKDLRMSLDRFSLADPIVINQDNTIIGGHQRINILKLFGEDEVDVRVPSRPLSKDEEQELNLRLNKNLGQWDFDKLANFDEELLKKIGFDSQELDRIFQLSIDKQEEKLNTKTFICDECGEEFGFCESITKFRLERNKHFFCSKECYLKYHSQEVGILYRTKGYKS